MKKKSGFLFLLLAQLFGCKGQAPAVDQLGARIIGRKISFTPCPDKPNCVSTFSHGNAPRNIVEPIKYNGPKDRSYDEILKIILKTKGTKLMKKNDDFIYATYTSPIFGFVDDLEIFFKQKGIIHLKSSSRVGHYDFNANKKRVEEIRFKFHQAGF